jgi:CHAT domain-containing protein/Tfp pilus assembly protein PilF
LEAGRAQRGTLAVATVHDAGGDGGWSRPRLAVSARAGPSLRGSAGRFLRALFAANLCAAAAFAAPPVARETPATGTAGPAVLQPGQPFATSLTGGETRVFVFDLAVGRYARAEVEQRGIDVIATLTSPQGETLVEADGPDADRGTERASALVKSAEEAGRFRLEVQSLDPSTPAGEIIVVLAEERAAATDDGHRLDAERAGYAAVVHWGRNTPGQMRLAIARYEEALAIWRRLDERRNAAEVATQLAHLHRNLGETNRSAEYFETALPLWRELGETGREAEMLVNLGTAYPILGDNERALAAATAAVERYRSLDDLPGEATALSSLGHVHLRTGGLEEAEETFARALALNRQLGARSGEGRTLANLGMVLSRRGEMKAAAEAYTAALEVARETGDRGAQAVALNNLSSVYQVMGEPTRSLERYQEVLDLVREDGDARGKAFVLNNIGALYQSFGQPNEALPNLRDAAELFERVGDRPAEARAYDNIGGALLALGRPREAVEETERGLAVARELNDERQEAAGLVTLARAYRELNDGLRALVLAEQALAVARRASLRIAEGTALQTVGDIHLAIGQPVAALEPLHGALAIHREVGSRPAEAETLLRLARAERALGRLDDARRDLEAAVEIIESVRAAVAIQELRATYLASKQGYYEEWIGLLMDLHRARPNDRWDARAFAVAERARARTLLDALAEVEAEVRSGLDPELAAEEERLRYRLNLRERDHQRAVTAGDQAAAAGAARDLSALTREYRALEERIRNSSPRYADLVQPQPLDASVIQAAVLDPNTLLLQYSLGQAESWLWAVNRKSLEAFRLPPRADIEARVRRFYELLTARNLEIEGETPAARRRRLQEADAETPAAAAALADAVLGPVAARLGADGPDRLVVVADGALHYVPFAALPKPRQDAGGPLLFDHEVVYVPSASALSALRRDLADRRAAPGTLAVLADPVFDAADSRVLRPDRQATAAHGGERRGEGFRRLFFSRREGEAIASLVPAANRLTAFDFEASRDLAFDGLLAGYRMVHFATHGVLNGDYPALSGLVLSLVDRYGEPREGFLRLHDIYSLELRADLVTLSACETALGREIRGEGLVGLSRGFMYAGAARVVASLWSVQDRATAETMRRFYAGMLDRGLPPGLALREAQIAMANEANWSAPYYWAPFVLHGEWR